jgi:hypothetical protein
VVSFRAPQLTHCPHCGGTDTVRHPSPLWRWALLPAWTLIAATCMGASLVGPMIIGLLPFLFGWGVCLLSSLYTRAYDPPACDACGKMVVKSFAPVIRSRPLASTQGDLAA